MEITRTAPPQEMLPRHDTLLARAEELEAGFLAEMLAHSGLGETPDGFGGGHGEDQFASFLRQEQARLIVEQGGLGLAQLILNSLVEDTRVHDI